MSLNGLDAAKVNEAYESAVIENGGWFLLHYTSRDEVDVLQAGTGGLAEVREAIAKYEEKSPLYGLLVYRRKKVLLKYVPEGTSRLLQARLVVHVQSVIEKFPHDAFIPLEEASEINETTLSSSVSAPRASTSTISNESRKSRRRLTEIAEDVGETPVQGSPTTTLNPDASLDEKELDRARRISAATSNDSEAKQQKAIEEKLEFERPSNYDAATPTSIKECTQRKSPPQPLDTTKTLGDAEVKVATFASSEALAYLYKPKIKLAPRPSLEGRHSSPFVRPVSTLPAGVRLGHRDPDTMRRPQTQQAHSKPFFALPNVHPREFAASAYNAPLSDRASSHAGSAATVPANPRHREQSAAATPEKQRLMKALQKRRKNQSARANASEPTTAPGPTQQPGSQKVGDNLDKTSATTILEKEPQETNVKTTSSESQLESPPKAHEPKEENFETTRPTDESIVKDEQVPLLPDGKTTNRELQPVKEDHKQNQPESTSTLSPHAEIETQQKAESRAMLPTEQISFRNDSTTQVPQESVHLPPQPMPEEVPLPLEDDEKTAALPIHDGAQDREAVAEPPMLISPQPAATSPQDQSEAVDPVTTSIHQVSESTLDRKQKPPPITPVRQEDSSRAPSLSEESLFEELQSATVEEAKSVSLSKSPPTPFSPTSPRRIDMRRSSEGSRRRVRLDNDAPPTPTIEGSIAGSLSRLHSDTEVTAAQKEDTPARSSSNPLQPKSETQTPISMTALPRRADSLSPTPNDTPDADRPTSRKSVVSSLISQRIKAFENHSSSASQPNPPKAIVTPAIVTLRKASLNTPPTSANAETGKNGGYFSSQTGYPTPSPSPHGFASRLFKSSRASTTNLKQTELPAPIRPTVSKSLSTGSIDSQPAVSDHAVRPSARLSKRSSFFAPKSPRTKSSSTSSIASSKDGLALPTADASASRLSVSSRRSSTDTQGPPRSQSSDSITSDGERKESKRKRLFKRLSNIGSAPRRTIAQALSPTLNSQPILESQEPEPAKKWSTAVTVGVVNVQFPDTLLWKLRHLEVDGHGYLVLSQVDKGSKVGTRRFHVSDFRTPYVPEPDREELPHSVALDFHDSSTLQCACENSASQLHVLQVLLNAHGAFSRESL